MLSVEREILILIIGWVSGHLLLWGTVWKNWKVPATALSTILLISVYALKPATGDLWSYGFLFDTGYEQINYSSEGAPRTEPTPEGYSVDEVAPDHLSGEPYLQRYSSSPLFAWTIKWASEILPHGSKWPRLKALGFRAISDALIIFVVGMGMFLIALTIYLELKRGRSQEKISIALLQSFPFVLGSVYFFVGSQNAIRQFLMLACCMLFGACIRSRKVFLAILLGSATITVHQFGFVFILMLIWIMIVPKNIHYRLGQPFCSIDITGFLVGLVSGVVLAAGIKLAVISGVQQVSQYVFLEDSSYSFRTAAIMKLVLIASYAFVSEILAARSRNCETDHYRYLRLAALGFIAPLVIYPEIFSRLLFFFFAIELLFVCFAVTSRVRRYVVSALVVTSVYGFAPNAINLLVGVGWLEVLRSSYF